MKPDWHMDEVVSCPYRNCTGLLLSSIYFHEMKCAKCGRYCMSITKFVKCRKPKDMIE